MAKRNATFQLTDRNWAEELEPEEAGTFSVASVDELKRRPIKKAKRRGMVGSDDSEPSSFTAEPPAPKSAFTGFSGFGSKPVQPATTTNTAFSLFTKGSSAANGSLSAAAKPALFPSSVATTKISATVKPTSKQADDATTVNGDSEGDSPEYLEHLKALNECVLSWIQQHVSKNPYCILTPIFTDYGKHLGKIEKKYPNLKTSEQSSTGASSSSPDKPVGQGFSFSQSVTASTGQGFSSPKTAATTAIPKKSNFSFGGSAPSSVSTTTASSFPKIGFFNIGSSSDGSPPPTAPKTGFFNIGSSSPSDGSPTKTGTVSTSLPKAGFFTAGSTTTAFGTSPTTTPTSTLPKEGLFNFGSSVTSHTATHTTATVSSGFSFGSTKTSNEKGSDAQPGIVPFSGFKFSSNTTDLKPSFTFGSAIGGQESKTSAPAATTNEGEEEYVPPKPEVSEVTEEGAVYTKRCKLFYQKDGAWTEKGLGNLHLKDVDGKIQLIIRADTSLGNVLLNIIITESTPLKRQGKNNVSLICVPNPALDPKQEGLKTPVPMLIRVKTGEDADELVDKIKDLAK